MGRPESSNSSNAAQVVCMWLICDSRKQNANTYKVAFSGGTLTGTPNATANGTLPSWSNVTLLVPDPSGRVMFSDGSNSSETNLISQRILFYGSTVMVVGSDRLMHSEWYGQLQGENGIHALYWNTTSEDQVPLTLRRMAPSSPPPRTA